MTEKNIIGGNFDDNDDKEHTNIISFEQKCTNFLIDEERAKIFGQPPPLFGQCPTENKLLVMMCFLREASILKN